MKIIDITETLERRSPGNHFGSESQKHTADDSCAGGFILRLPSVANEAEMQIVREMATVVLRMLKMMLAKVMCIIFLAAY